MIRPFLDISVTPEFGGLPPNLVQGLHHLTNNAAGLLTILAGLGVVVSVIGILVGSWTQNPHLSERSKLGFLISAGSVAILYVGIGLANAVTAMFQ